MAREREAGKEAGVDVEIAAAPGVPEFLTRTTVALPWVKAAAEKPVSSAYNDTRDR